MALFFILWDRRRVKNSERVRQKKQDAIFGNRSASEGVRSTRGQEPEVNLFARSKRTKAKASSSGGFFLPS